MAAKYSMLPRPVGVRRWRSPRAARTRACARARRGSPTASPTSSSRSREHDTANRGANAAWSRPSGGAVPARGEAPGSRRSTRASAPSRRAGHRRVGVHHALADRRRAARSAATASNTASVSCTVSIVSTVVVPLGEQLAGRQARRRAERRRRVRGLHRPDARAQPVDQREVVGVAAEQRLAQVDVRLDEARAARARPTRR